MYSQLDAKTLGFRVLILDFFTLELCVFDQVFQHLRFSISLTVYSPVVVDLLRPEPPGSASFTSGCSSPLSVPNRYLREIFIFGSWVQKSQSVVR